MGNSGSDPAAEDGTEMSPFYQSVMNWKNLQQWAQRVWAKRYQQSPEGSTQNVKPIIVQGGIGPVYISSAAESSPSERNKMVRSGNSDANIIVVIIVIVSSNFCFAYNVKTADCRCITTVHNLSGSENAKSKDLARKKTLN